MSAPGGGCRCAGGRRLESARSRARHVDDVFDEAVAHGCVAVQQPVVERAVEQVEGYYLSVGVGKDLTCRRGELTVRPWWTANVGAAATSSGWVATGTRPTTRRR